MSFNAPFITERIKHWNNFPPKSAFQSINIGYRLKKKANRHEMNSKLKRKIQKQSGLLCFVDWPFRSSSIRMFRLFNITSGVISNIYHPFAIRYFYYFVNGSLCGKQHLLSIPIHSISIYSVSFRFIFSRKFLMKYCYENLQMIYSRKSIQSIK